MTTKPKKSVYETLSAIDVSEHTEMKNKFTYLSWAWAWGIVKKHYPEATFRYRTFVDNQGNTLPFMRDTKTWTWVVTVVKIGSIEQEASMPVLDHRNKSVAQPDAFQVNTAQQRALAKACAMHGLGLNLYAGEDLPMTEDPEKEKLEQETLAKFKVLFDKQKDKVALAATWRSNQKDIQNLSNDKVKELQEHYHKRLDAIKVGQAA